MSIFIFKGGARGAYGYLHVCKGVYGYLKWSIRVVGGYLKGGDGWCIDI